MAQSINQELVNALQDSIASIRRASKADFDDLDDVSQSTWSQFIIEEKARRERNAAR
jgi:hypothetical protein